MSVSTQEFFDVIRSLQKGSPDPEELPFRILREYADLLVPAIQHVINLSFTSEVIRECLKKQTLRLYLNALDLVFLIIGQYLYFQ